MRQRFLRPAHVVVIGGTGPDETAVWLVDELQPVAARLGPSGVPPAVLDWRDSPIPTVIDPDSSRTVLPNGVGIVVQDGVGGEVTWVGRDDSVYQPADGVRLLATGRGAAWLAAPAHVDPGSPGADHSPPVPPPLGPGLIVGLSPDGTRREIRTAQPVRDVEVTDAGLVVRFAELPVSHRRPNSYRHEYPTTSVLVPWDELDARAADRRPLTVAGHAAVDPTPRPSGDWTWLQTEPWFLRRYAARGGGLLWSAGAPEGGDRIERRAVVVAFDPESLAEVLRIDLGVGQIRCAAYLAGEFWLAVARRRHLGSPRDRGVEVLAVRADGVARTVLAPDTVDITAQCRTPVRASAEAIEEYVGAVAGRFADLERYWQAEDGSARLLAGGVSNPVVTVRGEWPHTQVEVSFAHSDRPGLRLRRRLDVFDELGRPRELEHAGIYLMEDLETGYIAPPEEAVDGLLDT